MQLNYLAILIATILQFICGALWYSVLFGKTWGKIHGADKYSEEQKKEMMKGMGGLYALQFLLTLITTFVLALFATSLPAEWNTFGIAGFFWLGFVLPTQVSAVVFGGTDKKWILPKIAIMAGCSLVCLMIAAVVLRFI